MDSVIRNVVEPLFESVIKRINELDKKIIMLDTKMTKIENELLALGCMIDTRIPVTNARCGKMEEVD